MADNLGYTPGTGETIATDEIGGRHFQRIKLAHGVDGEATDVSVVDPLPTHDSELAFLMLRMLQLLGAPIGYDRSLARQRSTAVIESGTVTTVTTVTTVGNLSTIDTLQGRLLVLGQNVSAWQSCVRARIT